MVFLAAPAGAHVGPPFPVADHQRAGPYVLSVWTHPDTGWGTFYVMVDAGAPAPEGMRAFVYVQPVTKRLLEASADGKLESVRDGLRYLVLVPFDREERWRWRAVVEGPPGRGELSGTVYVTPPGPSPAAMWLYLLPFLAAGFLWGKALLARRRQRAEGAPPSGALRRK